MSCLGWTLIWEGLVLAHSLFFYEYRRALIVVVLYIYYYYYYSIYTAIITTLPEPLRGCIGFRRKVY